MREFSNLGRNEEVIMQATLHWGKLVIPGILSCIFVLSGAMKGVGELFTGFFMALIVMSIGSIPFFTEQLVITSNRLYGRKGLIRTQTLDTPLNKVNTVSVSSNLWGKIFGYGKIVVTSSSGKYTYPGIANPNLVRQVLMEQIERYDDERIRKQASEMAKAMKAE